MIPTFSFWQKWLFVVGLLLAIFGLALAFFNQTPLFDLLFNNQINPAFWPAEDGAEQTVMFQRWIYGVLGATVSGWGIFIAFIAHHPFRRREGWAWNCLALGIIVWYVADTAISLYFKVWFNAAFNTVLLVSALLPLFFTRAHFTRQNQA